MVCMPGEPAYPVLGVCPPPAPPTNDPARLVGSSDGHNRRQPTSTMETPTMATGDAGTDENPPAGFLLKWEMPKRAQTEPALVGAEGEISLENSGGTDGAPLVVVAGDGESGDAQTREGEQNGRRFYGHGGRPRGFGKVGTSSPSANANATAGLEA